MDMDSYAHRICSLLDQAYALLANRHGIEATRVSRTIARMIPHAHARDRTPEDAAAALARHVMD